MISAMTVSISSVIATNTNVSADSPAICSKNCADGAGITAGELLGGVNRSDRKYRMPPTSATGYPTSSQPAQRPRPRIPRTSAQGSPTAITTPPATASSQYQPTYGLTSASSRMNLALAQPVAAP